MARQLLHKSKKASALFDCLEEVEPSLQCHQEPQLDRSLLQHKHEHEGVNPVLHYQQHPKKFTALHQQLQQPTNEIDPSIRQLEEISPVIQYLQHLQESLNTLQGDNSLIPSYPRNPSQMEIVTQVPMNMTFTVPASTFFETRMANCPPEVSGLANKEKFTGNMARAQTQRASSKFSNGTTYKNAKIQTENRSAGGAGVPSVMPKRSTNTRNNMFALRPRTPSALCIHSDNRNDNPENTVSKGARNNQKGKPGNSRQGAKSRLEELDDGYANSDELTQMSRQYRPLGTRLTGSPRKTMKGSCEDITRAKGISGAQESLVPNGQDVKAEGKLIQEKKSSLIPNNTKAKYGTTVVEKLEEQARRTLYETGLIQGQKRLIDRFQTQDSPIGSSPYADCYELGYNMRSNDFQGGTLETKSLMKDSYTPDVAKGATWDPKHWHGRKTDDLGRWFQKNALNLSLQKALDDKLRDRKGGKP